MRKARRRPNAATVFGAAFGALMLAIGVNALALQRERHPAPWFEPPADDVKAPDARYRESKAQDGPDKKPVAAAPAPTPATAGEAAAVPTAPAPAAPATKPSERPRETTSSLDRRPKDPVGDLLRSGHTPARTGREPSAAVAAIQRTLKKLGYAVGVDGLVGKATTAAIARFEHDHRLPVKGQLTAKLFQEINALTARPKP